MKRRKIVVAKKKKATLKSVIKKPAKKVAKKVTKKATKPSAKSLSKKSVAKKKAAQKSTKKTAQKSVTKSTSKKTATKKMNSLKTAKKAAKKTTLNLSKKSVKKNIKSSTKKAAKKLFKSSKATRSAPQVAASKSSASTASNIKNRSFPVAKSMDFSKVINPLRDRVLLNIESNERTTAGGLVIPDTVDVVLGYKKGKVLAVGKGAPNKKGMVKPLDVKVGDTVLFPEYAVTEIDYEGAKLHLVNETDILGIVE